jgi:hypothetical protein
MLLSSWEGGTRIAGHGGEGCAIRQGSVVYESKQDKEECTGKSCSEVQQEYRRMDDIVQTGEVTQSSRAFKWSWWFGIFVMTLLSRWSVSKHGSFS